MCSPPETKGAALARGAVKLSVARCDLAGAVPKARSVEVVIDGRALGQLGLELLDLGAQRNVLASEPPSFGFQFFEPRELAPNLVSTTADIVQARRDLPLRFSDRGRATRFGRTRPFAFARALGADVVVGLVAVHQTANAS